MQKYCDVSSQPNNFLILIPGKLKSKEILTSFELCETLLKETGVVLLPGSDFGRQPEELTCRVAYADFDGEQVKEKAMNEYKNEPLQ